MGRRTLMIVGLTLSGVATVFLGAASSLQAFLAAAIVVGAVSRTCLSSNFEGRLTVV
jgi:FtsH-binding integral membrane protein